uniref:Global nitrogen transcriptional regulator n=1 Tax=Dasya naccarioides TaxID=2007180 RepID=A0A1Z1MGS6_9FLOR|nr:global nitrogen transcriptional regulator [Dasya naccarioides]ARW65267.1 global nitrogen transcriptional regulator [Dasya naccarioides]
MQWINTLNNYKIPYYIYKLNKGDKVIYSKNITYNQSIIILYGTIYFFKTINHHKIFPLAILNTNNIISLKNLYNDNKYYYKLIALENTYVISFNIKKIKRSKKQETKIFFRIIYSQQLTLKNYERMNLVLKHKYIKYRIIQMILLLFLQFGIINNNSIYIPFNLSQKHLTIILGTNKTIVNQTINKLLKKMIIQYSTKKIMYIKNLSKLQTILSC